MAAIVSCNLIEYRETKKIYKLIIIIETINPYWHNCCWEWYGIIGIPRASLKLAGIWILPSSPKESEIDYKYRWTYIKKKKKNYTKVVYIYNI